jgi:cobalt/nickel transport system permease protein
MIQLSYLDYSAVEGRSRLHRTPAAVKMVGVALVLLAVVTGKSLLPLFVLYGILVSLFLVSRVPPRILPLTFYPLLFAVLFILVSGFQIHFILLVLLKVLCGSTAVVLLLSTTPYPSVFGVLGKILPGLFVTALLLTYRSVFILLSVLEETEQALYLRGGLQWGHPWRSLINLSNAFGHLLIKGMDAGEKMYQSMVLRGFENKIPSRGE